MSLRKCCQYTIFGAGAPGYIQQHDPVEEKPVSLKTEVAQTENRKIFLQAVHSKELKHQQCANCSGVCHDRPMGAYLV